MCCASVHLATKRGHNLITRLLCVSCRQHCPISAPRHEQRVLIRYKTLSTLHLPTGITFAHRRLGAHNPPLVLSMIYGPGYRGSDANTGPMQKFLAGQRLPAYGGQSFTAGRSTLQLPQLSPEEAESAIMQLMAHPETEKPARPDAAASPAARPFLKTCKGVPFPKVLPLVARGSQ
jgi:hypothetical protein